MSPPVIHCYWSFRSPYSYIAMKGLQKLRSDFGAEVIICPVRPLALRDDAFFKQARPQMLSYMMADMHREAERSGISFRWPQPDPVVQNLMTREIAIDQPFMDRLLPLGAVVASEGGAQQFAFFEEISALIFNGSTDNWHEGAHMAEAVARAGYDLKDLEVKSAALGDKAMQIIAGYEEQQMRHHWGVPLMVYKDEAFFGQDRIDTLRWRIEQS